MPVGLDDVDGETERNSTFVDRGAMGLHAGLASEGLAADIADKRSDTLVYGIDVGAEMRLLGEGVVANIALEGLYT